MLLGRMLCLAASSLFSCAAASFFGAAEDSPGLRPAALAAGQLWIGHYTCHTPAWLLLHIEMVNATGLRAVFQFLYPSTAQTGSFLMHGTFGSGGVVKLLSGKWIDQPPGNVVPVSLLGVLQPSGLTYRGEVLHTGCGSFEVNRSAFDLGDPFAAPTLSLPGAALCARARGRGVPQPRRAGLVLAVLPWGAGQPAPGPHHCTPGRGPSGVPVRGPSQGLTRALTLTLA